MMITEDYVSLHIAKLLKEKGFNEECVGYYVDNNPNEIFHSYCGETNSTWESRCCSAPTHQMALKWLREVHNVFIGIAPHIVTKPEPGIWYKIQTKATVYNTRDGSIFGNLPKKEFCEDSCEQACEMAIKYCLENLV